MRRTPRSPGLPLAAVTTGNHACHPQSKETVMGNPVVHWELLSKQPAKIASFYEQLFGWKIQHRPELNYRIVETGGEGGINGGIIDPQREGPWPGNTTVYIAVDDLAAYRKRVV